MPSVLTLTLLKWNVTLIKWIFFRRLFKFSLKLIQAGLFLLSVLVSENILQVSLRCTKFKLLGLGQGLNRKNTCCPSRGPGGFGTPLPRDLTPYSDLWGTVLTWYADINEGKMPPPK